MAERERLEQAIAHLEAQRATLGDGVVDASIAVLRKELASLEPLPLTEQQRKQVTVLFADVSGFTAMSEMMDPEEVTEMMNALWERLDGAITDHGGIIDKHMGDAVMAVWGVDVAQEDDPERAIRAALAMQEQLQTSNFGFSISNLAVRIGINTGPVFLGKAGTIGEYTAIGDTVNLAQRLEQAAPVGGILISHDTYRHVRGVFDLQTLEPVQVKGRVEPVRVYLVQRARPRAFRRGTRGVEGIETRMIGRHSELRHLQNALYAVLEDHERQVVTILGEAGVGKSRLLYEFENWVDLLPETIHYFKGRASLEMQNVPYALIRDVFASRFQIQDNDPIKAVRKKFRTGIGEALGEGKPSQVRSAIIGQLLGFDFGSSPAIQEIGDDAQQLRDRGLLYISEYFRAMASWQPVLILLEDLHWADDSSLDLLSHMVKTTPDQRVFVVTAARPALLERRPHWGEGEPFHTRLELGPLSERNSRRLVEEILQRVEQLPEALRELVISGAEGNPFYVEELIKMLIEDGVIVKGEERWHVEPVRLTTIRVPPTLTGVLQARLDSLPLEERTILQRAAVVGRTFWDGTVEHIGKSSGGEVVAEVAPALAALRGKEMVFRRETSAFVGTREYIFKHAILRQVTYENVLRRLRRVYHGLVAEWLIERSGERASEYSGLIAEHLELAGRREKAAVYLRRAGEQAATQFANAEAVAYFSRALQLIPEADAAERYALLLAREKVYDIQGAREDQDRDLAALQQLADALEDDYRRAEVLLRRAKYTEDMGDYPVTISVSEAVVDLIRQSEALIQAGEAVGLKAEAYLRWGRALTRQADFAAARSRLEQALAQAQAGRLPHMEADCLRSLCGVAIRQGDYAGALVYGERGLRICQETTYRRCEAGILNNLGAAYSSQDDMARAREYYEQALCIHHEIGDRWGSSVALNNLGYCLRRQGDVAGARACHEKALHVCREIGNRLIEGQALGSLGTVHFYAAEYAAARAYYEQSLQIHREIGSRYWEGWSLSNLGDVCAHQGDFAEARDYCEQARRIFRDVGHRRGEGATVGDLGWVCWRQGRYAEATAMYEQALHIYRQADNSVGENVTIGWLGALLHSQGDTDQARAYYEGTLHFCRETGRRESEAPCLVYLGLLFHHLGKHASAREYGQQARDIAQELGLRDTEASAWTVLGHAQAGLGNLNEAAAAYRQALALRRGSGQSHLAMEPLAGLARVALAEGDLAQAQAHVEEILAFLESHSLDGTEEPLRVYLTCYQVLEAGGDPRSRDILSTAYSLLRERAAGIEDERLQRSFLEKVAAHREILAACDRAGGARRHFQRSRHP